MSLRTGIAEARWETLLGSIALGAGEFLLYLDPDQLDAPSSLTAETIRVTDRWALRRVIEQQLRTFQAANDPLLVHVGLAEIRNLSDLPFDARQFPTRVLDVRLPEAARPDVRNLPPQAVEQLVARGSLPERLASLARELTGLAWPPTADAALVAVSRLVPHLGSGLRSLLAPNCLASPARAILEAEEPMLALEELLGEWAAKGSDHPHDNELRAAAEDLSELISTRQLSIPTTSLPSSLPKVIRDAVSGVDALPEVLRLLDDLPDPGVTFESWIETANAWARCRWSLAAQPPTPATSEIALEVWSRWDAINDAWQSWLHDNYGSLLTRNVLKPSSVHRVAPFLAAHVVDAGSKLLLIVLDGLGVPQWQQIVEHLAITPLEDRRVLACLPTMTTVSRQAIFAGGLPTTFPASLDRTDTEPAHWQAFWQEEGLSADHIFYSRTGGADATAWQDPPSAAVVSGVAVNAVDDLMHGVSVNGDHQFHSAVTTWLAGGFLERTLEWANRVSAQVWITADHGNLPCVGLGESVPDEGVRVLGRGLRARMYASERQRMNSPLAGLPWTPPSFPSSAGAPLFALGRTYFRKTGGVITHGGLSLDEVVVPLARLV
jgi:hypothetical protein